MDPTQYAVRKDVPGGGGGGVATWTFYCFTLQPDMKLYWGAGVGVHLLQTDGCRPVWFPWHETTTDKWPGSQGSKAWKHSVPAKTGREVRWWLLFALLRNVKPASPHHRELTEEQGLGLHMSVSWDKSSLCAPNRRARVRGYLPVEQLRGQALWRHMADLSGAGYLHLQRED